MEIAGLGLNLKGEPLFPPQDEAVICDSLIAALERNAGDVTDLTQPRGMRPGLREARRPVLDVGDPRVVGWTFLLNDEDPHKQQIIEILRPLARERGMVNPDQPLRYRSMGSEQWLDWLNDEYSSLALTKGRCPKYVLIVGDPRLIPFGLQSLLATSASVGRLDFESLTGLQAYVDKLLRLEDEKQPPVTQREAIFFAPEKGPRDPTHFSRNFMAMPMAQEVRKDKLTVREITGEEATKPALEQALRTGSPALVYTASHGLGAIDQPLEVQKRQNGSIICQQAAPPSADCLFGAEDVSHDRPFLEGSVFFQFACFGYGTPAKSEFADWLSTVPRKYADTDFTAALPRKLLSHPRGPIAYIGHLDIALLHGFTDVRNPEIDGRWSNRIQPYVSAVKQILGLQPSGLAMHDMAAVFNQINSALTGIAVRQREGKQIWNLQSRSTLLDRWLRRGDAQNYMVMGDPAAHLRLPDHED